MRRLASFLRQERGATAVEFALVLPVALLFLLGIIDVGRYAWAMNRYEKAVQMGARYAVVTDLVPGGLNEKTFENLDCDGKILRAGDAISCPGAIGTIKCEVEAPNQDPSCECTDSNLGAASCEGLPGEVDGDAFQRIVNRMRVVAPSISAKNVIVTYSGSGIGFVYKEDGSGEGNPGNGNPGNGNPSQSPLSDVSPLVTVSIHDAPFRPISLLGLPVNPFPTFRHSLTLEDGVGRVAY